MTITNVSGHPINYLDDLFASGGGRVYPLPYPFSLTGSLENLGTRQTSIEPEDLYISDSGALNVFTLQIWQQWQQLIQAGIVTIEFAPEIGIITDVFIATEGQTEFILSKAPSDSVVLMSVEGILQQYNDDYTVVDSTLTYSGDQVIGALQRVQICYLASSDSLSVDTFISTAGQTVFELSKIPDDSTVLMSVEGILQQYNDDYTVVNKVVTYTGDQTLEVGERVQFFYIVGYTPPVLDTFVSTGGQTEFILSKVPQNSTVLMSVEGILQQYNDDYTVVNKVVTYTGDQTLEVGERVQFFYSV